MPIMSKNQTCFCCEPRVLPVVDSQEMTNQQLEEQTLTTTLPNHYEDNTSASHNISTNATKSPWLQDICLNTVPRSQQEWNHPHRSDMPAQLIHEFEMCQIQDPQRVMSATKSVTPDLGGQSSCINFHVLQNRELGGKHSISMVNEMKALSSSDLSSRHCYKGRILDNGCDNAVVCTTNTTSADSMDLDSALDELGMLSTVTNSRRQYLLETQGHASFMKRDHRLRSKSESSPNLSTLYHSNGYHIVQMNSNFVTNLSGTFILNEPSSLREQSLPMSESSRFKYRNSNTIDEATRHQRSVPRMSRMRKDRYLYRRSRCPYKIPYRLCSAIQESSRPDYFSTFASPFSASLSEIGASAPYSRRTNCQKFKSDVSSVNSQTEVCLVRSLSAEYLRHIENEPNKDRTSCDTEQNLDSVTSRMTNLHMS